MSSRNRFTVEETSGRDRPGHFVRCRCQERGCVDTNVDHRGGRLTGYEEERQIVYREVLLRPDTVSPVFLHDWC
ncbi:Hypothetical predicted protein [Marmota monax]|uniref:Uncharacterized protein n=1 Tax=Marmota monax TaxID=9995 RepID=A0A5E4A4K8_MARMO|nr:Hypothetical predicted protein [Marmota monax]